MDLDGMKLQQHEHLKIYPECIYFLYLDNELRYIGRTVDLTIRTANHLKDKSKTFNKVFYLPVRAEVIQKMEYDLIKKYAPPDNNEIYIKRNRKNHSNIKGTRKGVAMTRKRVSSKTNEEPENKKSGWPFRHLPEKEYYRPDEVEKHFNLGKGAAYGLVRSGHCDATRIGGNLRIPRSEILRMSGLSTSSE